MWGPLRMALALAIIALSAASCGGSSVKTGTTTGHSAAPTGATTTANQPPSTTTTTVTPPSNAEAASYVRTLISPYEDKLKAKGADMFGKPVVECAATGGTDVECILKIPFRRLDVCGLLEDTEFIAQAGSGLRPSRTGSVKTVGQICYIGPNGQPVPSKP